MKTFLPLIALTLLLAGCTTPDESDADDADANDTNDTTTGGDRGSEVGSDVTVTTPEGNTSTNSTPSNSTG